MKKCLAVSVVLVLTGSAIADEFWRQNPVSSPGGYSSQDARNPGGLGWFSEVADNFAGEAGWNIEEMIFWGGYVTQVGDEGNTEGFTIRVYTDNGSGLPGTRIFERDVAFVETLFAVPFGGFGQYQYSCVLSPPLSLTSTETYWISTVAILARGGTANEPQWGWNQSTNSNAPSGVQWFFSPGNFAPVGGDFAFVLNGTTGAACNPCDANCDGSVNLFDIEPFVSILSGGAGCGACTGDANNDGSINLFDIESFVDCLSG